MIAFIILGLIWKRKDILKILLMSSFRRIIVRKIILIKYNVITYFMLEWKLSFKSFHIGEIQDGD
jgi:hypothetical protein